jgi:hypothetical protein
VRITLELDKTSPGQSQNKVRESPKTVSSNGNSSSNGHELSVELNDLIFELIDTINHMGLTPAGVKKTK